MISSAAPCVNAISTGALTKLSSQPKRSKPKPTCSRPDNKASHMASATH